MWIPPSSPKQNTLLNTTNMSQLLYLDKFCVTVHFTNFKLAERTHIPMPRVSFGKRSQHSFNKLAKMNKSA